MEIRPEGVTVAGRGAKRKCGTKIRDFRAISNNISKMMQDTYIITYKHL